MTTLKTLSLRRDETRARLLSAVRHLSRDLASFSETSNGAFYLFGSFVRGDVSDVSDVGIMVDVPEPSRADAMDFAETACLRYGLKPDVRPAQWVSTRFAARLRRSGRKL